MSDASLAPDAAPDRLDRLAPRARLLIAAIAIVAAILTGSLPGLAALLAIAAIPALTATADPRPLVARLAHVEGFLVVALAILPFTTPGTPVVAIGPLAASAEGLRQALTIALRVNACILIVATFVGALGPVRFARAGGELGLPPRLVALFNLTYRHVELIRGEYLRLAEAMRARAFVPRSRWHTWRSYANLIGMIVVRALDRAERVDEAMRCRAYAGRIAARVAPPPLRRHDRLALATALALATLVVGLDRLLA